MTLFLTLKYFAYQFRVFILHFVHIFLLGWYYHVRYFYENLSWFLFFLCGMLISKMQLIKWNIILTFVGTLKWATVIDGQIEKQNRAALNYFSERATDIISTDKGLSLNQYLSKVKEMANKAMRKSNMPVKEEIDQKLQKFAKVCFIFFFLKSNLLVICSGDDKPNYLILILCDLFPL